MQVTVREFLRQFPEFRKKAECGETVEVRSGTKVFLFHCQGSSGSLVGCCKASAPKASFDLGPVEDPGSWEID